MRLRPASPCSVGTAARLGAARLGRARRGWARRGEAGQGAARQGEASTVSHDAMEEQ